MFLTFLVHIFANGMLSFSQLTRNLDSPLGLFIDLYFDICCCDCYMIFQSQIGNCYRCNLLYIDLFCLFHAFEMCTKYYGILPIPIWVTDMRLAYVTSCGTPKRGF